MKYFSLQILFNDAQIDSLKIDFWPQNTLFTKKQQIINKFISKVFSKDFVTPKRLSYQKKHFFYYEKKTNKQTS